MLVTLVIILDGANQRTFGEFNQLSEINVGFLVEVVNVRG